MLCRSRVLAAGAWRCQASSLQAVQHCHRSQLHRAAKLPSLLDSPSASLILRRSLVATPSERATPSSDPKPDPESKLSRWQQLKTSFREYGIIFIGYYAVTWTAGLGVVWGGLTLASFDGAALLLQVRKSVLMVAWPHALGCWVQAARSIGSLRRHTTTVPQVTQWTGLSEMIDITGWPPWCVNVVIAGEINELAEPFRLPFLLATTPALSRALRGRMARGSTTAQPPPRSK